MRLLPTKPVAGLVCASLVAAAAPAQASAFPCFDDAAMPSARIHDLKVNLMVNSLKCREVDPMTLRTYGQLLDQRSGEFAAHGLRVKKSLENRFGPRQGAAMFDDYETQLGNFHSGTRPSFEQCEDTAAYVRLASRANSQELATLSRLVTNRGIRACPAELGAKVTVEVASAPVSYFAPARGTVQAPAPAPAPAPARAQAPAPAPQMVDGIPTYPAPGMVEYSEAEPLERIAVRAPVSRPAPVAAPEPVTDAAIDATPADREARLAQAITALDAAAAALRGMQTGASPSSQ